jgi:hypothetical protein
VIHEEDKFESENGMDQQLTCDVAVIGGSFAGVAAALAAVESGANVILTESLPWIGGQVTSQGVAPLDEHPLVEKVPATRTYEAFRSAVRAHYQQQYGAPAVMPDGKRLNPGNGWVSALCFEPLVGLQVLQELLAPHIESGRLRLLLNAVPTACEGDPSQIKAVHLKTNDGMVSVHAQNFLDATDTGELLPLAGVPYVTGAEAKEDTDEEFASPDGAHPERIQSFTYCFVVEFCPGEKHVIEKPAGYEENRDKQPYSLTLFDRSGAARPFHFFKATPESPLPFWTYRRVFDAALLDPSGKRHDLALINWHGNDYHWANPIDQPQERQQEILEEAKQLSLGFLYWLQTEVPRDDGKGLGYPELRLAKEALGTADGLSMAPYWRESRRIIGRYRIVAEDILVSANVGNDQAAFPDSVGIGWYAMDLHPAVGDETTMYAPTLPFQIPLGALIPQDCDNLIASCKNINTTHLSNGAYRLQPVEWSIGEVAGSLAAFCSANGVTPAQVHAAPQIFHEFQQFLHQRGVLTSWPQEALDSLKR